MDFLNQMMKLPFAMIATTLEPFMQIAIEADRLTNSLARGKQSPVLIPRPVALPPMYPGDGAAGSPPIGAGQAPPALLSQSPNVIPTTANYRSNDMNDNQVKVIKYRIVYVQPDEEIFLYENTKVIDYATSAEEFSAQMLVGWVADLQNGRVQLPRPALLPAIANPDNYRYLRIRSEVLDRYQQEDKYYDKRQTKALEVIARRLAALGGE